MGLVPLILAKKEEMTEERKASRASKSNHPLPPPPPLVQGLEPPLVSYQVTKDKVINRQRGRARLTDIKANGSDF